MGFVHGPNVPLWLSEVSLRLVYVKQVHLTIKFIG